MENNSYFPIDVKTICWDEMQSFNIFFLTKDNKMVLYCANGEVVSENVRKKILEHNVKQLFIHKDDKKNYDRYIEKTLGSC